MALKCKDLSPALHNTEKLLQDWMQSTSILFLDFLLLNGDSRDEVHVIVLTETKDFQLDLL